MIKTGQKQHISIAGAIFCVFLILFPMDSALAINNIAINNFIAIFCFIVLLIFDCNRINFKKNHLLYFFIAYVAYQLLLIVGSPDILSNRNIVFIFYCLFAFVISLVKWNKREKRLFIFSIAIGIIFTLILILTQISFDDDGRTYIELTRNIDQNYLCANFIFATVLLSNTIFNAKTITPRIVSFIILLLEFVCILFLGSRSGFLGNGIAVFLVCLVNIKKILRHKILLLFICVLLVVFFSLAPDWIKERFNIINMLNSSGSGRTEVWLQFLTIYASGSSFEVLFGFGRGSIYYFNELGMTKYCTHNIYLKALIEGGVIGVLFFVLLVISIFVYIKKTRNYTLIALIGGYMICGIFLDLDDYRIFPLLIITLLLFGDTEYYLSFKKNKTLIVRNDLENIGSNVSL